jgi:hypothetical protein
MTFFDTVRVLTLVGLAFTAASCTRQVGQAPNPAREVAQSSQSRASGLMKAADADRTGPGAYIGDAFATEQKSLGARTQDPDSPTF